MTANGPEHLPTWVSGKWSIAAFRDSLISNLQTDRSCTTLCMYFYAVTRSGWDQLRRTVLEWQSCNKKRTVLLFVGTDHGITDPSALTRISADGVDVRLMREYNGVFHPKVVWLQGSKSHAIWVGSNNLTRDGLMNNVEFALIARTRERPLALNRWAQAIEAASTKLTPELLRSYETQRRQFENKRARTGTATFTWKGRVAKKKKKTAPAMEDGSLIIEVMQRETGGGRRQLQLPVKAASEFFGVTGVGSSDTIALREKNGSLIQQLTITVFDNSTVRIVISNLEYRDRPCVLVFRKIGDKRFEYEIVSESVSPNRYKSLLALCTNQTRRGSRRWVIT